MNKPARIASLISSATEILYGIGVGDRVVAVSHECDFPAEVTGKPRVTISRIDSERSSGEIDSQVKQQVAAGQPLYEVDWSLLEELRPDLILTQAQCDVCAVRYSDVIQTVQSKPCFGDTQVASLNPNSIDDVLADIERIGDDVGEPEAAARFTSQLRGRIARHGSQIDDRTLLHFVGQLRPVQSSTENLFTVAGQLPLPGARGHLGTHQD